MCRAARGEAPHPAEAPHAQATMQMFQVQVPQGVGPGMQFHANIGGQLVAVQVPNGVGPGATLQIQVPMQRVQASSGFVQSFIEASSFDGAKDGYTFKKGARGLGYYRDGASSSKVQQQAPRQMPRQPTMSMNEEMDIQRKKEEARKARLEEMEAAKREQGSALAQIERNAEARQHAPAHAPHHQQHHRNHHQLGGASARPGEVSALCECLAVEMPSISCALPWRLTDAHLSRVPPCHRVAQHGTLSGDGCTRASRCSPSGSGARCRPATTAPRPGHCALISMKK